MTRPYSNDLRERAMARVAAGETIRVGSGGIADQPLVRFKMVGTLRATGSVSAGRLAATSARALSGAPADWLRPGCRPLLLRCGTWRRSLPSAA